MAMDVLYEDNHCLVLNKPAGLLTQGVPDGLPSLEHRARDYLREKYQKKGRVYLGIPHRLDRPVSGVVLFARQTKSAQRLAEQFQNRSVKKVYQGFVEGHLPEASGTWEDWMRKIPDQAKSEISEPLAMNAKQAILHFQVQQEFQNTTLVEIILETGRMHQIRLQFASRGFPIVGDTLYGATSAMPEELENVPSIGLHARSLTFLHPISFESMTVEADLPKCWSQLLQ